jgi:hypothetical protein
LTARVLRSIRIVGNTQAEVERLGLTTVRPSWDDERSFSLAYLCTASYCLESMTDSHGECIHCGEPVVRVWDAPTSTEKETSPHG